MKCILSRPADGTEILLVEVGWRYRELLWLDDDTGNPPCLYDDPGNCESPDFGPKNCDIRMSVYVRMTSARK